MDKNKLSQLLSSLFNEDFLSLIENVDRSAIEPVALLLNVKCETLLVIVKLIPRLLSGDIDLKSALPSLVPVFISYMLSLNSPGGQNTAAAKEPSAAAENENYENLKFISGEECSPLDVYLQSASASS